MSAERDTHERIEELIAVDALGGLSEADRRQLERELAAHGPECETCRRLLTESGETAALLALGLEPLPMSKGAEDRLVAAAKLADAGPPPTRPAVAAIAAKPKRRRTSGWQRLVAVAAVAVLLITVAGIGGYLLRSPSAPRRGFLAFASDPHTQVVHFTRTTSPRGIESLAMYYQPGHKDAWVAGSHISDPPDGKVYELWYLPQGSKQMAPAGTFVPTNQSVVAPVQVEGAFSALAVSVEPHENPHPTSTPVFEATPVQS